MTVDAGVATHAVHTLVHWLPCVEPPVYYRVASITPSEMALYQGDRFPDWQSDLPVGSLQY